MQLIQLLQPSYDSYLGDAILHHVPCLCSVYREEFTNFVQNIQANTNKVTPSSNDEDGDVDCDSDGMNEQTLVIRVINGH